MSFEFDKKITVGTLINALIILAMVISGFVYIQSDVNQVKEQQEIQENWRQEARNRYITRDQLDYMVLQRLDRMEQNIEVRLDRIEKALND